MTRHVDPPPASNLGNKLQRLAQSKPDAIAVIDAIVTGLLDADELVTLADALPLTLQNAIADTMLKDPKASTDTMAWLRHASALTAPIDLGEGFGYESELIEDATRILSKDDPRLHGRAAYYIGVSVGLRLAGLRKDDAR